MIFQEKDFLKQDRRQKRLIGILGISTIVFAVGYFRANYRIRKTLPEMQAYINKLKAVQDEFEGVNTEDDYNIDAWED